MVKRRKNRNGKFDLGTLDALPHPPPSELRARDLDDEQLARIDHAGWLEDFARITLLPSPVPMTPRRLGTATRLQWAARYIKLLQETLLNQNKEILRLTTDLTETTLTDVTPPGNPIKEPSQ